MGRLNGEATRAARAARGVANHLTEAAERKESPSVAAPRRAHATRVTARDVTVAYRSLSTGHRLRVPSAGHCLRVIEGRPVLVPISICEPAPDGDCRVRRVTHREPAR
jgi:hypothetical protein